MSNFVSLDNCCLGDIKDILIPENIIMTSVKQETFDVENVEFIVSNDEDFIQLQEVYREFSPVSSQRFRRGKKRKRNSGIFLKK